MSNSSSNGISLPTILAVVFTVLKLTGVIAWSWWWVLSPLWITFAVVIVVFAVAVMVAFAKQ